MAPNSGDIVKALCSHCKVEVDAQVVAAVGDEIVTVTCRTCGTSQRHRDPDGASGLGRRVVDVEPRRNTKRPRSRSRRVVSTTGREIPDVPMPVPASRLPEPDPRRIVSRTAPAASAESGPPSAADEELFQRWDAATDRVDSRYARPHRAHESYEVGEAVLDKIHGMGIVEGVAEDGKLNVLFKRGYVAMESVPKHLRPQIAPPADDDEDEDD